MNVMENERTNTERLIQYLKDSNFNVTVNNRPSESEIKIIKEKIAKNKEIRGDQG